MKLAELLRPDVLRAAFCELVGRRDVEVSCWEDSRTCSWVVAVACDGSAHEVRIGREAIILRDALPLVQSVLREMAGSLRAHLDVAEAGRDVGREIARGLGVPSHLLDGDANYSGALAAHQQYMETMRRPAPKPEPREDITLDAIKALCEGAGIDGASFDSEGGWRPT